MAGLPHPTNASGVAELAIAQRGATIEVSHPAHTLDFARFFANEIVEERHFSTRSCAAFRERVLAIWGAGGSRTIVKMVARCGVCGRLHPCEVEAHRTDSRLSPEDRARGVRRLADHDGFLPRNGLGKRPESRAPKE